MAEYLSPCNTELSIEEKQKLFAIRNQMTNFEMKFNEKPQNCFCGKIESIEHFYSCEFLNKEENEISFQNIYSNNIKNQIKIFRRIQNVLQWDQSSPGNSASHYSDQSMIKLDFSAA